jgi:hypothetical protein
LSHLITAFPLCILQTEMKFNYSSLILKYAELHKSSSITSDVSGDSYYHMNEELREFFEEITISIKEYCTQIGYAVDKFDFYITKSWINNFDNSDGTIHGHTHVPSDISICYYPNGSVNQICFDNTHKMNEVIPNSFSNDKLFKERTPFSYNFIHIEPKKNNLLVFPSKASHWVSRSDKIEHRVSFSADFIVVLKENIDSYEHVRNSINTWRKF